ncbi:MAG: helix-turn-helix domain-containing protein [Chloroflexota bacterium]|nr:helix-turn-helix domain-containing protein [Chloroflexota bacterium]
MPTFGSEIRKARIEKGLSLREVASKVDKDPEPGRADEHISLQYLNDIEHNRRNPPSPHVTAQLAKLLGLSSDYLLYLSGELPKDIRNARVGPERLDAAYVAFRRAMRGR